MDQPDSQQEQERERELPAWLTQPQDYEPLADKDAFVGKTFLQISSLLAQLRFDDGVSSPFVPSGTVKVAGLFATLLMVSLARNFAFVLFVLAGVLVVACLLPRAALRRVAGVAAGAAFLTVLVMLPAALLGQAQAPVLLGTKALTTAGLTLEAALTTPPGELTATLRRLRVPSTVILTVQLTLRTLVALGTVAQEVLTALKLRSVGRNTRKAGSIGGVAGVTFVKAAQNASATYDAMRCRGFTGTYDNPLPARPCRTADIGWLLVLTATLALFLHLHRVI